METGSGWFEAYKSLLAAEAPAREEDIEIFQLGEVVELRGRRFRIMAIAAGHMSLRLLPQAEVQRPD